MCRRPLLPLLALAALLSVPQASEALKCFQCSEPNQKLQALKGGYAAASDPICSKFDASNDTFKKDCPQSFDKSCYKNVASGVVVARGCYNAAFNNCTVSGDTTECFCTTDYCNSADLSTPALLLLLPAALLAALGSRQ